MKKITLLAAIVTFCSFAFAQTKFPATNTMAMKGLLSQYKNPNKIPKITGKQIIQTPIVSAKKTVGDTLLYEDFANGFPGTWSMVDLTGTGGWAYSFQGSQGQYVASWGADGIINSATSSNGFMILDADGQNPAQPFTDIEAYFTTAALDFSLSPKVMLTFTQYFFTYYGGEVFVSVSNDGANFTEFDVSEGYAFDGNSVPPNSLTGNIDISCVAGGQSSVYVRFHWRGTSHYMWQIDDILISEVGISHELSIEFDYYLDPWLAPHYSMIPVNHVDTAVYAVEVKNNRDETATGVSLNVTVNDGTNDVFNETSASNTINGCVDSTYIGLTNGFLCNNLGTYTVDLEVSLDSSDSDLSNNTVSYTFEVTDTVFARDLGGTQYELTAASYGTTQPYEFGNWYDFVNADTVTSISIHLGPSTVIGTVIQGKVYANDLSTVLGGTVYHTVVIGDPGSWVTMSMDPPLGLPALSAGAFTVAEFSGTDTNMTVYGATLPLIYNTSFLIHSGGVTPINQTPNVRLNVQTPNPLCNLTATTPTITTISCNGGSDGAVSGIVPSGGTGSYSYLWSPGGLTSADITGLSPDVYTLTITDSVGCMYTLAADVAEPEVLTIVPVVSDITCNGASNGSVVGSATGGDLVGSSAITYFSENFNSPSMPSGFTLFDVDGNTPNAGVTPLGFDGTDATAWVIADDGFSNNVAYSNSWYDVAGTSDDWMITDSINIGGSNVILSWDAQALEPTYPDGYEVRISTTTPTVAACLANPALFTIASENATLTSRSVNLTAAGYTNQTVYIAFRNNSTDMYLLTVDNILVETPAVASAYQYSFDGGAYSTSSSFDSLAGGTYSFKVMDANGCEDSTTVTIVEPAVMGTTFSYITANCGVGGSATISVTGGSTPYTYLWDDPNTQTTSTAANLLAGYYSVTVTDSNACVVVAADSVLGTPAITLGSSQANPSACGFSDGWAAVTVLTGTSPYNYAWDDPGTQLTDTATGLSAGIFNVTVQDIKLCLGYATVVLIDSGAPLVVITDSTQVSCLGGSDGTAEATPFGGTAPFVYSWNTSPVQTGIGANHTATGLSAGTYNITVTDASNCSGVNSTTITEPSTAVVIDSISVTNVSCGGGADGAANLVSSGGTGTHTYVWSNSQTTQNATGLTAGASYTVTVTDANGCTAISTSDTITEPAALVASASGTNITCNGDDDGAVDLTVSGGVTPYVFAWSNSATTEDISGLSAGAYQVTVTDGNGCTSNAVKSITEPSALSVATISVTNVSTNGGSDGSIVLSTPSGGTGTYTYSWIAPSFTSSSANISNLVAGNYVLTVSDANGCLAPPLTVTITEPPVTIGEADMNVAFSIYPNPNSGEFMIEMNNLGNEDYVIEIRNIIGQLVIVENISNASGNYFKMVDLEEKERGVYFVSLTNKHSTITKKLVIY